MTKKTTGVPCGPSPAMEDAWRARDDAETLRRAGEIMGDKGRVKAATNELNKSMSAIKRVVGAAPVERKAAPNPKAAPRGNGLGFAKGRR